MEEKRCSYSGVFIFQGVHIIASALYINPETVAAMQPMKVEIDKTGSSVQGESKVFLEKSVCNAGECNLGNFFCDAMIHAHAGLTPFSEKAWTNVSIAMVLNGSLRIAIKKGNVTYANLVTMSPFENKLQTFSLPGDKLIEALEYGISEIDLKNGKTTAYKFVQVAGLKIVYNVTNPVGQRVVEIEARCADCEIPFYENFDTTKTYRIVAPIYLSEGGDGFTMLQENGFDRQSEITDLEALSLYTKISSPIYTGNEKRITILS